MSRARWCRLAALGMSLAIGGCKAGDECTAGQARCEGNRPVNCYKSGGDVFDGPYKWATLEPCGSQTCTIPPGKRAICADSPDPDPLCQPSNVLADPDIFTMSQHCAGDMLVTCLDRYRTGSVPCGGLDSNGNFADPGGRGATHCVDTASGGICVPPGAAVDPACPDAFEPVCVGTTLVQCRARYAVARTTCVTCTDPFSCRGYLGDSCAADSDCVTGLVCHADGADPATCTMACAPAGGAAAAQACADAFAPGGLPLTDYVAVPRLGVVLVCGVAGYCVWVYPDPPP